MIGRPERPITTPTLDGVVVDSRPLRAATRKDENMQIYSDPSKESDTWSLPNVEVFEMSALEAAESVLYEDDQHEYLKRFPLATMNSRDREKMVSTMVEELGIKGGWFYWYCLPGCLPDSSPIGPFDSCNDAVSACRNDDLG